MRECTNYIYIKNKNAQNAIKLVSEVIQNCQYIVDFLNINFKSETNSLINSMKLSNPTMTFLINLWFLISTKERLNKTKEFTPTLLPVNVPL